MQGPQTILSLVQKTSYNNKKIREALFILFSQNIITCTAPSASPAVSSPKFYHVDMEVAFERLFYPLFIDVIQRKFGELSASAFVRVLIHRAVPFSSLPDDYRSALEDLYLSGFLVSSSNAMDPTNSVPSDPDPDDYSLFHKKPNRSNNSDDDDGFLSRRSLIDSGGNIGGTKKMKLGDLSSSAILTVNKNRFFWEFHCEWMVDFMASRAHPSAGIIMRALLSLYEETKSGKKNRGLVGMWARICACQTPSGRCFLPV